ncbi:MAG: cupin domain-containing protein [Fimbriimonadaceae bacterium]|nr:cupin domain-containing protein [Fimbriimonadaceae bacterium]
MAAHVHLPGDDAEDHPIALLARRRVAGDRMLLADVRLQKGCHVATHSHESEQIAFVVSGRVTWRLGEPGSAEYREETVGAGAVVVLPSGFPHGVDALEDTHIVDVLSPPGEMGVDSQRT